MSEFDWIRTSGPINVAQTLFSITMLVSTTDRVNSKWVQVPGNSHYIKNSSFGNLKAHRRRKKIKPENIPNYNVSFLL